MDNTHLDINWYEEHYTAVVYQQAIDDAPYLSYMF